VNWIDSAELTTAEFLVVCDLQIGVGKSDLKLKNTKPTSENELQIRNKRFLALPKR
jgi:hypothetical protein